MARLIRLSSPSEGELHPDLDLAGGEGRTDPAKLGAVGIVAVEDTQVIQ